MGDTVDSLAEDSEHTCRKGREPHSIKKIGISAAALQKQKINGAAINLTLSYALLELS